MAAKSGDEVIRTRAFDTIANSFRPIKWPVPYDSSGVLRNKITGEWDDDAKLNKALSSSEGAATIVNAFQKGTADNDPAYACIYCGKGVGKITAIQPAYEILTRIESEMITAIQQVHTLLPEPLSNR